MPAHDADLRASVARYYTSKLNTHGACARGVDWNSDESQRLRFAQLLKLCEGRPVESILDYGCGYGALAGCLPPFLAGVEYRGYDASPEMVAAARRLIDYDRFCRSIRVPPPSEFGSDFNAVLGAEIKSDLTFYGDEETDAHLATRLVSQHDIEQTWLQSPGSGG